MQRGLVGSEMCIRDSINAEYMGIIARVYPFKFLLLIMAIALDLLFFNLPLIFSTYVGCLLIVVNLFVGIYYLYTCLLYTSDAADDTPCVDLGGRRIIKKKKNTKHNVDRQDKHIAPPETNKSPM
eukprot:TRINITY_DN53490_c0_g1_i1.p2 TRINITY_DN53490_c0_g1~~TRINITY_DN53490_c0_g1_i1.p2  ORF type:complete len:125 (-),score=24.00 TRINITY_DN53490_c0_g1_i1:42-416(-)